MHIMGGGLMGFSVGWLVGRSVVVVVVLCCVQWGSDDLRVLLAHSWIPSHHCHPGVARNELLRA